MVLKQLDIRLNNPARVLGAFFAVVGLKTRHRWQYDLIDGSFLRKKSVIL